MSLEYFDELSYFSLTKILTGLIERAKHASQTLSENWSGTIQTQMWELRPMVLSLSVALVVMDVPSLSMGRRRLLETHAFGHTSLLGWPLVLLLYSHLSVTNYVADFEPWLMVRPFLRNLFFYWIFRSIFGSYIFWRISRFLLVKILQ